MNHLVEQKIQQITHDVEAIERGEMLSIYNEPEDKKRDEAEAIRLQEWRIEVLTNLIDISEDKLVSELAVFEGNQIVEKSFETAVLIDLYKIALGVL